MSEKRIYEIAQMMQNRDIIENDFHEAFELVSDMFKGKYINRLNSEFKKCHNNCRHNPCKEVQLIRALKPFMHESQHEQIESMADTLLLMQAFQSIQTEVSAISKSSLEKEEDKGAVKAESAENRHKGFNNAVKNNPAVVYAQNESVKSDESETAAAESAIHDDGIYEVDDKCLLAKQNYPGTLLNFLLTAMMLS